MTTDALTPAIQDTYKSAMADARKAYYAATADAGKVYETAKIDAVMAYFAAIPRATGAA